MNEQQLIGTAVTLLCGLGWYHQRWFLVNTRKGRWLSARFGERGGAWVLRGLLTLGISLGLLLATDVISPLRW